MIYIYLQNFEIMAYIGILVSSNLTHQIMIRKKMIAPITQLSPILNYFC